MFVLVFHASQCEVLVGSVFASCHGHISPNVYQQHCRYQACRCGSSCLCTVLAHYAYLCSKHGVNIDFRSQLAECGECLASELLLSITCLNNFQSRTQNGNLTLFAQYAQSKNTYIECENRIAFGARYIKCVLLCVFVCTQGWCVLEACYTALARRLAGGPVALCLAQRRVTLTTAPRGVAVQTAATMTTCASAVCNCKTLPPRISS